MKDVLYLGLVLFFGWEIRNVCSFTYTGPSFNLAQLSSGNMPPQSSPGLTSNPCDATRFTNGLRDAQLACHKECLTLKAEISRHFSTFSNYKSTQYLLSKCGMATEGRCSTAAESPICWCYARQESRGQQKSTLSNCRSAVQLLRKFTNAMTTTMEAVHMQNVHSDQPSAGLTLPPQHIPRRQRTPRQSRTNTGVISSFCGCFKREASPDEDDSDNDSVLLRRPGKEAKTSSSGKGSGQAMTPTVLSSGSSATDNDNKCLYTNVGIDGNLVQVVVDTGAAVSTIPPKYAKNIVQTGPRDRIYSVGEQHSFEVSGTTTINIIVGRGVSVSLSGNVVDRGNSEILLGNNFFVAYAAKIKITERTMELSVGQSKVEHSIQFLNEPGNVGMINQHRREYTSLLVSAYVNGIDTRVCVDTGSTTTFVNRNIVRTNIRPPDCEVSFGNSGAVGWFGMAEVNLILGHNSVDVTAYIPNFTPDVHLLLGNDFIPEYVHLFDYEARIVTFKFPRPGGISWVRTQMFVMQGE